MRQVVLLGLALAAPCAIPALGADFPPRIMQNEVATRADYDWSGVYVGFNIGSATSELNRTYPNLDLVGLAPQTFTSAGTHGIYGVHGGIQWQWGHWIVGVEASYSASFDDFKSAVPVSPPEPFSNLVATSFLRNLVTVGPRLGFGWDRLMVYGTGGYASADIFGQYNCADTGLQVFPGPGACSAFAGPALAASNLSGGARNEGWFAGGGIDYMLYRFGSTDVLVGAEYRHFDLGRKVAFCFYGNCNPRFHQDFQYDGSGDVVRARLTLKTQEWHF